MKDRQSDGSYLQHRILRGKEGDGGSFRLAKDLGDGDPFPIVFLQHCLGNPFTARKEAADRAQVVEVQITLEKDELVYRRRHFQERDPVFLDGLKDVIGAETVSSR